MNDFSTPRCFSKFFCVLALVFICFACFSCSGLLGYGVLLWSIPDEDLYSGDVVPVYIRSNINNQYVIGTGSAQKDKREIPLWQIELFKSKKKAQQYSVEFSEYRHVYAETMRDGLPMRESPENTSERVYRLKLSQRIKILKKGKGAPVTSGGHELEGDWLLALTDDGQRGWVYSYSLRLYNEEDEGSIKLDASVDKEDSVLVSILENKWYPDSYRLMQETSRVDLDKVQASYGFFPGSQSGVVRIEQADQHASFPYSAITKTQENTYRFEDTAVTMELRSPSQLFVSFTDKTGVPQYLYFCTLTVTPEELIQQENERRETRYNRLMANGTVFSSNSYGRLQLLQGFHFMWSGYQLLTPNLIPEGSGSSGTVDFDYFIHSSLKSSYDGAISFTFDGTKTKLVFLYTKTEDGLRLEEVYVENAKDKLIKDRNFSPLVLFFAQDTTAQEYEYFNDGEL